MSTTPPQPLLPCLPLLLLAGCAYVGLPPIPVASDPFVHQGPTQARGLIVLLPGLGNSAEDFREHGLLEELREHAPDWDVTATDLHYGYYRTGTVLRRLHADVVAPARRAGYGRIWLLGVSMGGLGALAYASEFPDEVEGVLLIAPFLGPAELARQMRRAGGNEAWLSSTTPLPRSLPAAVYRRNVAWLSLRARGGPDRPRVYLGHGELDRLRYMARRLGKKLPPERYVTRPGGHKWAVFRQLLGELAPRAFAD